MQEQLYNISSLLLLSHIFIIELKKRQLVESKYRLVDLPGNFASLLKTGGNL